MAIGGMAGFQQTTTYKVVLPFYAYGALSFLTACILLLFNTNITGEHHFHPVTLTITHLMALGWGTMVILGASHQLLPVLICLTNAPVQRGTPHRKKLPRNGVIHDD